MRVIQLVFLCVCVVSSFYLERKRERRMKSNETSTTKKNILTFSYARKKREEKNFQCDYYFSSELLRKNNKLDYGENVS